MFKVLSLLKSKEEVSSILDTPRICFFNLNKSVEVYSTGIFSATAIIDISPVTLSADIVSTPSIKV